jgi:hypothetical protein
MVRSNAPSRYVVGVQKGGTGVTATFASADHQAGNTLFLVGKYDFAAVPNAVYLWINPDRSTFGGLTDPSGFVVATTGTDGGLPIDRFNFRQNTAASVPAAMQWDELRVGLSWASVTPPPPPALSGINISEGLFQFSYSNASAQTYTVFASTNLSDWSPVGRATENAPGLYRFDDVAAGARQFYQLRSP